MTFRKLEILDNKDDLEAIGEIEETIQTNLTGLIHCTRKGFRLIEKSGDYGMIINTGSSTGHVVPNVPDLNVYPGTKYAVRATTEVKRISFLKVSNNDFN